MTSDFEPPEAPDRGPTTPPANRSGFASPTGMVALGGLILIGTYVVFGLILNDYWVSWIAMVLAISSLLLLRAAGTFVEKLAPAAVLIKFIGYLLAVVGLLTLIEDLRFFDGTLNEFPNVIGALAGYAGYVIAFLGARSINT